MPATSAFPPAPCILKLRDTIEMVVMLMIIKEQLMHHLSYEKQLKLVQTLLLHTVAPRFVSLDAS